jgi:hypothetical protein
LLWHYSYTVFDQISSEDLKRRIIIEIQRSYSQKSWDWDVQSRQNYHSSPLCQRHQLYSI